ncbi:uncharacterized protein isoform X2 [Rhodnius prolixus]|uniref:uncharacterized protein isoform X2 n=1 Tax=Rhodnius prolixus TaxID=13249 RepID=UPI003D18E29A
MVPDWFKSISLHTATLLLILYSVHALDDPKLCFHGNVTVFNALTHKVLVAPDKCFPTPVLERNQLSTKPLLHISNTFPKQSKYVALMVEFNSTFDKYDIYWMEPNLTVKSQQFLEQNTSIPRDIRKMIEYRQPKQSALNVTYFILVYRQTAVPVELPKHGPFKPQNWAIGSGLTLVGRASFIVRSNLPVPSVHQPLPLAPIPPQIYPQQPHPGIVNTIQNNSFARNYTNHTYPGPAPVPYYPVPPHNPPPQPNPYYPPPQPNPYNPPPYHPPNQFYPPSNVPSKQKGKKGAAVDLQAATSLITIMAFLSFVLNL